MQTAAVEQEILEVGRELMEGVESARRGPLKALEGRGIEAATQDAELRAALLRFVDVAPACRSLDDLASHLVGYLEEVPERPLPLDVAVRMAGSRAGRAALGSAAVAGVRHVAHRFIVGETPRAAERTLRSLWADGIASSVDLLGEATVTAAEADRYAARCAGTLRELAALWAQMPVRPALEADSYGPIPRVNLSVKVSALTPLLKAEAPEIGERDAAPRLRELLRLARELGAHLHVDMESFDSREAVTELVLSLLSEDEFRDGPSVGLVLQAYLVDAAELCERIVAWAGQMRPERAAPLTVRLVKGAYWDHEVVEAAQHGWRPPVFVLKRDSDRSFEQLTLRLLQARPHVRPAIASHNLRSIAHAIVANRRLGGQAGDVEFQVLRGLGDELAHALSGTGQRVRAYCPIGGLVAGMAYLVRRLLENTSNESFLADQARGRALEELLAAP